MAIQKCKSGLLKYHQFSPKSNRDQCVFFFVVFVVANENGTGVTQQEQCHQY